MPEGSCPSEPLAGPTGRTTGGVGKKALGKGLGALIGESRAALGRNGANAASEGRLREIAVTEIAVNRRQPRRTFSDDELEELAASIMALGVVQPIVVRPCHPAESLSAAGDLGAAGQNARFELIAGERRLRAAKLAGLSRIPALVRTADEMASLEIALAENVAREDLNAIEEAQAYAALADEFGLTHERIAELVGRSRASVTNLLRLLDLPDEVRAMIECGELSEGHGRALLALPDHHERRRVARVCLAQGLTVRRVEALVRKLTEPEKAAPAAPAAARSAYDGYADDLYGILEAPVRIRAGKRGGAIQIAFKDGRELERLVALLRSLAE